MINWPETIDRAMLGTGMLLLAMAIVFYTDWQRSKDSRRK
jgi:hypothetical protein